MLHFAELPHRSLESLARRLRSVLLVQVVAVVRGEGHLRPSDRQRARHGRRASRPPLNLLRRVRRRRDRHA